ARPQPTTRCFDCDQLLIDWPTLSNFDEAFLPSSVTAAMQTTAISATRSAYSTSEAPFSSSKRARSQVARNSYEVIIGCGAPYGLMATAPGFPGLASCRENYRPGT